MKKITKEDIFEKDVFDKHNEQVRKITEDLDLLTTKTNTLKAVFGTKEQTELLRSIDNNLRFFFWITIIPIAIFVALFGVKFLMSM